MTTLLIIGAVLFGAFILYLAIKYDFLSSAFELIFNLLGAILGAFFSGSSSSKGGGFGGGDSNGGGSSDDY